MTTALLPRVGVYIHWPFCRHKCPYCDFNVHIRQHVDHALWQEKLLQELAYFAAQVPDRQLQSIYFGGGTPSLMAASTVKALINACKDYWPYATDLEITLEANPNDRDTFAAFAEAGVNRLSLGVQSFNDADLQFLGRDHNAEQALQATHLAQSLFERVSLDLIYARPEQAWQVWQDELQQALALGVGHISLYQLTIEPKTPFFHQVQKGQWQPLEADNMADLYERTQDHLARQGLPAYEISNHARPGQESRHNRGYWRGYDYIGLGPGAHGRLTIGEDRHAFEQRRAPELWLKQVREQGHGIVKNETLSAEDRLFECLAMGLRTTEGITQDRLKHEGRETFTALQNSKNWQYLWQEGWLRTNDTSNIIASRAGRQRLDALLAKCFV